MARPGLDRQVVTFRQGIVSGRITRLKTEASRMDEHSNNSYGGVVGLEGEYAVQRPRRLGVRKPSHGGETPVLARLYARQLYPADRRTRWPRPHRRHTSGLYGGMSLDAKRKAQSCLVKYVRHEAKRRP